MSSDPRVAVIICCYNSVDRLPQTLKHLAQQVVPEDFYWEIMLVNNASTDNTVACAKEIWSSFEPSANVTFRITDESRPGQMYARKRGVLEAKAECLIFCDDDNWLNERYVFLAVKMMEQDPLFGAGGGQNIPATDAPAYPDWWDEYQDKYALGIPAAESGEVTQRGFVLGAGLVTRRSLFLKINSEKYPSLLSGRNGEVLTTGDDFEYCKRLMLWGYKLYYENGMVLTHFIPKERLTVPYREKLMWGILEAGKVINEYDHALYLYRKNKHKNRWRLLFLAPFRILCSHLGLSGRKLIDEELTYFYLAPFKVKSTPARMFIKKFMHRQ